MTIALVDCNSFYASCESVFAPHLQGKPVIVLSNNDGCCVARSPAAKAIGIKMREPFFKIQHLVKQHQVAVFSSNYTLYGDMSQRVMTTLATFTPDLEIYSIDEAFLDLSGFTHLNLEDYGHQIRDRVYQWTGIPVSIGIGSTKTLAKIANRVAKKSSAGVCDLAQLDIDEVLGAIAVGDVWGIGRRWSKSLQSHGINTALQLREADPSWIRQRYNVIMQRTVMELRSYSCMPLELGLPPRQTILRLSLIQSARHQSGGTERGDRHLSNPSSRETQAVSVIGGCNPGLCPHQSIQRRLLQQWGDGGTGDRHIRHEGTDGGRDEGSGEHLPSGLRIQEGWDPTSGATTGNYHSRASVSRGGSGAIAPTNDSGRPDQPAVWSGDDLVCGSRTPETVVHELLQAYSWCAAFESVDYRVGGDSSGNYL